MKCYNLGLLMPGDLMCAKLSLKARSTRWGLQFICLLLMGLMLGLPVRIYGQDIDLQNPSLEGAPAKGRVPPGWNECGNSPDTQPLDVTYCGITLPASAGKTYVGLLRTSYQEEGLSQKLATPLKAGVTYTISFDMAYPSYYCINTCYGQMAMYGGDSARDKGEVLWISPEFTNAGWQRFTAVFTPKADHEYLSCWAYVDRYCSSMASAVLIDNFSPGISAVPQLSVSARATCKGTHTGQVVVAVKEGTGPFKYEWTNSASTSARADHLGKGLYAVKVTSKSGAEASAQVQVDEVEVAVTAQVTPPSCHGLADAQISLQPAGGTAPYSYSFDGGRSFTDKPVLAHAFAGSYSVKVQDVWGCEVNIDDIAVKEPDALQIADMAHLPTSCRESNDGKILLTVTGGTAPYLYKVNGESWQGDSAFINLAPGIYDYQVADGHNCTVQGSTEITRDEVTCAVIIPTAFSPNGDGKNDRFRLWVHDAVTSYRLTVYNRWGATVFSTNDPGMGWDGMDHGRKAEMGQYLWMVTYTDGKNQAMKQTGSLSLIR